MRARSESEICFILFSKSFFVLPKGAGQKELAHPALKSLGQKLIEIEAKSLTHAGISQSGIKFYADDVGMHALTLMMMYFLLS